MADDRWLAALREPETELDQACALLRAAGHDPARTTLGSGDRILLRLHRDLRGEDVELTVTCPACGELGTLEIRAEDLPPAAGLDPRGRVRAPTYADLLALRALPETLAADALLERCTVETGAGTGAEPCGPAALESVDDALTGPLRYECPACGAPASCEADVQRLVLAGLVAEADAIDAEIHLLAREYHWTLDVIESLPAARRHRLATLVAEDR